MDLSFLIVSWNVCDLLQQCLQSINGELEALAKDSPLPDHHPLNAQIIVVDNASSDDTLRMLQVDFPQVQVLANSENVGFTRGNNQALAEARGRYLFLLNPDAELQPGALAALLTFMESHPRVGLIGPRLWYADGSLQSSRRRFPTLATAFFESTILQLWFPHNATLAHYYMLDTDDDAAQEVDWVTGAAMFVRRELYEKIGGLDEGFFMYSEELDWCYRAKRAGWQVVYLPAANVLHREGQSSGQVLAQRDIYFHSSKVRFFRKYHGSFAAGVLRLFLLLMFAFQLLEEGAKWLLGHKRPLRAARVRAYWQVLASGLK
ncbi:MAG: glycosyltransferase family 2 protein [Chloroflexi bacterium]|nr:glycosyltransferase family 2 protein [Chloroflexota bacterium]